MTFETGGCGLYLKRIGAFFFLLVAVPLLAMHVLYSPLEQQLIDYAHQLINYSRPTPKESDLIAFICGHDVYTVHPDGTKLRRIRQGSFFGFANDLSWSPDGVWLTLPLTEPLTWHNDSIYKLRFDGSLSKRLTYDRADGRLAVWTPDGAAVQYLTDHDVWRVSADGGRPTQLDVGAFKFWNRDAAAWSPARDLLIMEKGYHSGVGTVGSLSLLAPGAGGKIWEHPVAESMEWYKVYAGSIDLIRWSPKGDRIVFRTYQEGFITDDSNFFENYRISREVHILNLETREESTIHKSHAYNISWSPDGEWLALISPGGEDRVGQRILRLVNASTGIGSEIASDITDTYLLRSLSWSPDGKGIAFALGEPISASEQESGNRIFTIQRDGSDMKQIAELDCNIRGVNWSPR